MTPEELSSLAKEARGVIRSPFGNLTPFYCASCGRFAGYVFGDVQGVTYLCAACDRYGTGFDLQLIDESTARAIQGG